MVREGTLIYKVSQITSNIKLILEGSFPNVWVEGEVSNLRMPLSGHIYFTLKDDKSELKCVFFRGNNERLKFELKEGMHVICNGRISVYERQGAYQLYVQAAEPVGIGALQLAFRQLKEKLLKEGLFDESHKRPIPKLPERIGIVTSPTGAAIRDILNVLKRRFANIKIIINPVRVQGDGAKEEIKSAIEDFNKLRNVDVIIIARGGGSIEDLWAFNEEAVARAVYNSEIPVISAVGHEIDWMITDYVADLRAPTPSVAAEIVLPRKEDLLEQLNAIERRLREFPVNIIRELEQRLDDIEGKIGLSFKYFIELRDGNFRRLAEKLELLSPLNILGRGYTITFKLPSRGIVKDSRDLKKGDLIETRFSSGFSKSRVEEVR